MKKLLGFVLLISMLMVGPALASQITILNVSPGIGYVGQINFTINDNGNVYQTWGYCIEEKVNSYIGTPYTGEIREIQDGLMLNQASLLYYHYVERNLADTAASQTFDGLPKTVDRVAYEIQETLWNPNLSSYSSEEAAIRSMFKWVDVPNNSCGFGQDFIIAQASPVPEPATMMLFGTGLIFIGAAARKRFRV